MKRRTLTQNASFHKWMDLLAEALNDAGFSQNDKEVIRLAVPFSKENIKTDIVHKVMTALYPDIDSTAKLDTKQIQEIYKVVDQAVAANTGVRVEWPTDEPPMLGAHQ